MTKADLRCRGIGILLIIAGLGSGFVTYGMPQGPLRDLGDAADFAVALTGFGVASLGTLLLFGGSRLRARWLRVCDRARIDRTMSAEKRTASLVVGSREDPFLHHAAFSGCGRMAIATYLILRAQNQQQTSPQQGATRSRRVSNGLAATPALQHQHEKI